MRKQRTDPRKSLGVKFGRLRVLSLVGRSDKGLAIVRCMCDCGSKYVGRLSSIRYGSVVSCGCFHREIVRKINTIHGQARFGHHTKLYRTWRGIKNRCGNKNFEDYKNYGGRGIRVCKKWINSFEAFAKDMGNPPTKNHWIERVNNNGNYTPSNCIWATRQEQCRNMRTNVLNPKKVRLIRAFRAKGMLHREIAEKVSVSRTTVCSVLNGLACY